MIKIICLGKIKESYFKEAILEYQKRLSKYTKLNIIELDDIIDTNPKCLELEKESILKNINEKDYIITLEIDGKELNSVEFSDKIKNTLNYYSNITFIIGSSKGLHKDIIKQSHYHLSFSTLTFPHQLFRVILLEQIYRSFKIINNETYHK